MEGERRMIGWSTRSFIRQYQTDLKKSCIINGNEPFNNDNILMVLLAVSYEEKIGIL